MPTCACERLVMKSGLLKKVNLRRRKRREKKYRRIAYLRKTNISPTIEVNKFLQGLNTAVIHKKITLENLLKRPQIDIAFLKDFCSINLRNGAAKQIEIEVKYGVLSSASLKRWRGLRIWKDKASAGFGYMAIPSLSREIKEKLIKGRPLTLGQASRISG